MNKKSLVEQIRAKQSYLCVGLDTDIQKIPSHLRHLPDPVFEFNKQIIDATIDYAVAYKPNIAFYECLGSKGWESLARTVDYLPKNVFKIADAKRGDIGNTAQMYAKTFFEYMDFDALTVAPYMGCDSVEPFLQYPDKWLILLGLTSNSGSQDFQQTEQKNGEMLFETVIRKSKDWGNTENMMYVAGATKTELFEKIRKIVPDHFLLVPGVGAQGGDLAEVSKFQNADCGLLVNLSRSILYASEGKDFAQKARQMARETAEEMGKMLYR